MTRFVLDASALIAELFDEPGADTVHEALESGATMSAVNVAEVAAKLDADGWAEADVPLVFEGIEIVPFDERLALLSGRYRSATRHLGLGLGDRACLAAAYVAQQPALTADRLWKSLKIEGVEVVCIR